MFIKFYIRNCDYTIRPSALLNRTNITDTWYEDLYAFQRTARRQLAKYFKTLVTQMNCFTIYVLLLLSFDIFQHCLDLQGAYKKIYLKHINSLQ
jgi:hypothetical protein